jgi:hypothetical protein
MSEAPIIVERLVEARTMLGLAIPDAAIAARMPPGWTPAAFPQGPSAGANALFVLGDRLLGLDGAGAPIPDQERLKIAVLAARAVHQSEVGALVIVAGVASHPAAVPGPYGVFAPAESTIARTRRALSDGTELAEESWSFQGRNGERVQVDLAFTAAVPVRRDGESNRVRAVSAAKPDFSRTYLSDQGEDVAFSRPGGIDRLHARVVRIDGGTFDQLFEDTELVSVISVPWLVRTVTIP